MAFIYNPASLSGDEAALQEINLGTKWGDGESLPIFVANAEGTHLNMKVGTEAVPDKTFGSALKVSRTLSVAESTFTGDGSIGLGAITAVDKALSTSQGQALGVVGGANTASSYVGEHSNADAFGGAFIGRSLSGSTRVGGGLFATGQRNNNEGKATGAEISTENNAENAGVYTAGAYSNSMGLWLAPKGSKDSGAAAVIGHPTERVFKVGYAANEGSVSEATFRDDSTSLRSILITKAHEKAAIAVASGANGIVVGAEAPTVASTLLDVYFGESALTPGVVFGTDKAKNASVRVRNSTSEFNLFAVNTANQFVTGSAQGDAGCSYSPGKIFHIGAVGKTSQFRTSEAGLGFYGTAPIAKPEVTGSRATGAAYTSLLEKLATIGLITNGSTA